MMGQWTLEQGQQPQVDAHLYHATATLKPEGLKS
jgi:hypothetical protein